MADSSGKIVLRLGARGSLLSRMQSQIVADTLQRMHPGLRVELTIITTSGDTIADRPLHEFGGKGLFTKELEIALLERRVDFAVHSFKDVPVTMPLVDREELITAAVPRREDPRDVLVAQGAIPLTKLEAGARVGTGSLRRQAQVLALRPDLKVEGIRGNVDTRLRKLRDGKYDATILAMAGLRRSGLFDASVMSPLDAEEFVPAAGQGALSIQCRRDDARTRGLLAVLNDPPTAVCVDLERSIVRHLNGDCHSPIAALATIEGDRVRLRAAVVVRDGRPPVIRAVAEAPLTDGDRAVNEVMKSLHQQNVATLLGST